MQKSDNYCQIIDHIPGTVIFNMVILLQINKKPLTKVKTYKKNPHKSAWLKF